MGAVTVETADDGSHHHQLIDSAGLQPNGDAISGRIPLFHNADVVMGVVLPATAMPADTFYRNGEGDEMLFVHEGTGVLRTNFGDLAYHPGDYLVLPIGTTWRLDPDAGVGQRMLYLECPSELEPPKRYRNDYGQLLEHSPYSQRDIRVPGSAIPPRTNGRVPGHRPCPRPPHRLPLRHPPVRRRRAGTATCGHSRSTSPTSSRSPAASTSRPRSTRRSPRATSSCARSCRASSTTTRSRSRRRTTTRTSTATRSSTTSPATS